MQATRAIALFLLFYVRSQGLSIGNYSGDKILQTEFSSEATMKAYNQLESLFDIYFNDTTNMSTGKQMKIYDFFGYGCHCLPANGSPMKHGYGRPVDELDGICFNRKKCMDCLASYGEHCNTQVS